MAHRSHITQILQNYFDSADRRSRESPTSIEIQLLNLAGVSLEDLNFRLYRETSQTLQNTPSNIDNRGVYYSSTVPDDLIKDQNQTSFTSVVGSNNGNLTTLSVYDDKLPIPSRIEVDQDNLAVFTDPLLFTAIGSGDNLSQIYTVQHVIPGIFPVPNKLTLLIDQLGFNQIFVSLTITGETVPQPAWITEQRKTTETLLITNEGVSISRNRWSLIDKITIHNLPIGVRLRGWSMPFNLPIVPDISRPYTTPEDRDVLYSRYWQLSNSDRLLYEMYRAGGLTGLEVVNSYLLTGQMVDVAVEPFTNGLFLAASNKLYYADRREYQANLKNTGLTSEPLYGLQVSLDTSKAGPTRYVNLSGIPYANAGNIFNHRYTINGANSILANGALGPITSGWKGGPPVPISFAMLETGDYEFRLEMQDGNGNTTFDVVPYHNSSFTALKSIDVSGIIDIIKGVAFDSYGKLWIWNGRFAMPLIIHYDGYIFDPDSKTIFVTDKFESLQIS